MKIHGLMLIKDEADIVEYTIKKSQEWCDYLYVYDNGSTDGTWETIISLSRGNSRIVPFKRENVPFNDGLRGSLYRKYCNRAKTGDWWCRLDADEVYIDDPKDFLFKVPSRHHVVWTLHHQYYLTASDLLRFQDCNSCSKADETNLPKHYCVNASEARFFRHRARLNWPEEAAWPSHMGIVHPNRIRLRHYKYRSPLQIQKRLRNRENAVAEGHTSFKYDLVNSWREKIVPEESLHKVDEQLMSDNLIPGKDLPQHLEKPLTRLIKIVLHGTGVWP